MSQSQNYDSNTRALKRVKTTHHSGLGTLKQLPTDLMFFNIMGFTNLTMLLSLSLVSQGLQQFLSQRSNQYPFKALIYKLPVAINYQNLYYQSFNDFLSTYCPIVYDNLLDSSSYKEICLPVVLIYNALESYSLPREGITKTELQEYIMSSNIITYKNVPACWKVWATTEPHKCNTYSESTTVTDMIIFTIDVIINWFLCYPRIPFNGTSPFNYI